MSDKLVALLMPSISPTMSEEDRARFFAVLDHMFKVELPEHFSPQLYWATTLRGRFRKEGSEVRGDFVKVVSRTYPRKAVIWMIVTRQIVFARSILHSDPVWPGDKVNPQDIRTWRFYPDGTSLFRASPSTLKRAKYIDWQGVQRTPTQDF